MTKAFSEFERTINIADIAAGQFSEGIQALGQDAQQLSDSLAEPPQEMAELVKQIQFFGLESQQAGNDVARFSQMLAEIGETDAPLVAKNLTRLLNITRREGETVTEATKRFDELAGAIFQVGTNVTAGVTDLLQFIDKFKVAGVTAGMTEKQLVAIAGSVADLDDSLRAITTTAMQRVFLTEEFEGIAEQANKVRPAMNATADSVRQLRKEQPVEFLRLIVEILQGARERDKMISVMRDLKVGTLRTARGMESLIANWEKAEEMLDAVQDEQANLNALQESHNQIMGTTQKQLEEFGSSLQQLMVDGGRFVTNALLPITNALADLADKIRENQLAMQAFVSALIAVPTAVVGVGVAKLISTMKPLAGLLGFLGGGRAAKAAMQGDITLGGLIGSNMGPRATGLLQLGFLGGGAGLAGPAALNAIRRRAEPGELEELLRAADIPEQRAAHLAQRIRQAEPQELRQVANEIRDEGFERAKVDMLEEGRRQAAKQGRISKFMRNPLRTAGKALGGIQLGRLTEAATGHTLVANQMGLESGRQVRELAERAAFREALMAVGVQQPRATGSLDEVAEGGQFISKQQMRNIRQARMTRLRQANRLDEIAQIPLVGRFLAQQISEGRFGGLEALSDRRRRLVQTIAPHDAVGTGTVQETLRRRFGIAQGTATMRGLRAAGRHPFGAALAAGTLGAGLGQWDKAAGFMGAAGLETAAIKAMGPKVPAGWLAVLQILAPLFDKLGDKLRDLAEDGGTMDLILDSLSVVAETLALLGNSLNFAFNLITKAVQEAFELINIIPGIDINLADIMEETALAINELNTEITQGSDQLMSGGQENNVTVYNNIQGGDTGQGLRKAAEEAAIEFTTPTRDGGAP